MKKIICLSIPILFVLNGCKKTQDDGCTDQTNCVPLPDCSSVIGAEYYTTDTVWANCGININNLNELVVWDFKEKKLVIYNIATGTKTALKDVSQITGEIKWNGEWIIYNRYIGSAGYGEIYKIKPDGSENQLLTEGYDRFNPLISPNNNTFMYDEHTGPVILDFDGNYIRQIPLTENVNFTPTDWYVDSLLLCDDGYHVYTLNLNTGTLQKIADNPNENGGLYFGHSIYITRSAL